MTQPIPPAQWTQTDWERWLRENAGQLYGQARLESLESELIRMAQALARMSAHVLDLTSVSPDHRGDKE